MIDERAGLKRARKHHLTPLEGKTIAGIEHHIETLSLPRLRSLLRAMGSCTQTNCGWVSYRIAELYSSRVALLIREKAQGDRAGADPAVATNSPHVCNTDTGVIAR